MAVQSEVVRPGVTPAIAFMNRVRVQAMVAGEPVSTTVDAALLPDLQRMNLVGPDGVFIIDATGKVLSTPKADRRG